jgi:amino acid transporter
MGNKGGSIWASPVFWIIVVILLFMAMGNSNLMLILAVVAIAYFCVHFTNAGGVKAHRRKTTRTVTQTPKGKTTATRVDE